MSILNSDDLFLLSNIFAQVHYLMEMCNWAALEKKGNWFWEELKLLIHSQSNCLRSESKIKAAIYKDGDFFFPFQKYSPLSLPPLVSISDHLQKSNMMIAWGVISVVFSVIFNSHKD